MIVLDGLRAGRTAVSASPSAPVLLRNENELAADLGDATPVLVTGLDGTRRAAGGRPLEVLASARGHVLVTHQGAVISLTG